MTDLAVQSTLNVGSSSPRSAKLRVKVDSGCLAFHILHSAVSFGQFYGLGPTCPGDVTYLSRTSLFSRLALTLAREHHLLFKS